MLCYAYICDVIKKVPNQDNVIRNSDVYYITNFMAYKNNNNFQMMEDSKREEKDAFGVIRLEPSVSDLADYWLDLDKESEPLDFLFHIDVAERLLARCNIQIVKGREKTGKSAYGTLLMTAALKGEFLGVHSECTDLKVLWADTEQDEGTLRKRGIKVCEMAGIAHDDPRFCILALKKAAIDDRLGLLLAGIQDKNPDFVFLDGAVDLCRDFNDNRECFGLVDQLGKVAEQQNCAILCVIHTNKVGLEARGHLGGILQQKCSEVYLLKRPIKGAVATVEQQLARYADVPDISFRFGEDFAVLPADLDKHSDNLRSIMERIFARKAEYRYNELCGAFCEESKLGVDTAKKKIRQALEEDILCKNGNGNATRYVLNGCEKLVEPMCQEQ